MNRSLVGFKRTAQLDPLRMIIKAISLVDDLADLQNRNKKEDWMFSTEALLNPSYDEVNNQTISRNALRDGNAFKCRAFLHKTFYKCTYSKY